MKQDNKAKNKKTLIVIGVVLGVLILIGILGSSETNTQNSTQQEQPKASQQQNNEDKANDTSAKADDAYMEALRKCSVMEAFDIQTTGIGRKTDNAFNDGREHCESLLKDVYGNDKDAFIKDVDTDWSNRKNEKVDDKDMTYYLSILGW